MAVDGVNRRSIDGDGADPERIQGEGGFEGGLGKAWSLVARATVDEEGIEDGESTEVKRRMGHESHGEDTREGEREARGVRRAQ